VTGTELEIVTPPATDILGPEVDRLATLHTAHNARTFWPRRQFGPAPIALGVALGEMPCPP
jgi:hypothetical protein